MAFHSLREGPEAGGVFVHGKVTARGKANFDRETFIQCRRSGAVPLKRIGRKKATTSNDGSRIVSRKRTIRRIKAVAEARIVGFCQPTTKLQQGQSLHVTAKMLGAHPQD